MASAACVWTSFFYFSFAADRKHFPSYISNLVEQSPNCRKYNHNWTSLSLTSILKKNYCFKQTKIENLMALNKYLGYPLQAGGKFPTIGFPHGKIPSRNWKNSPPESSSRKISPGGKFSPESSPPRKISTGKFPPENSPWRVIWLWKNTFTFFLVVCKITQTSER